MIFRIMFDSLVRVLLSFFEIFEKCLDTRALLRVKPNLRRSRVK